jgi:hypothetical protein
LALTLQVPTALKVTTPPEIEHIEDEEFGIRIGLPNDGKLESFHDVLDEFESEVRRSAEERHSQLLNDLEEENKRQAYEIEQLKAELAKHVKNN